jgi:uncharacterized protein YqjF (DUF2071 family)
MRAMSERRWSLFMRWHDLLFAHWPLAPHLIRPLIPGGLELDLFEGEAWIGVVPFRMSGIRHRLLPLLPGLSAFPELNVRTYVSHDGRTGVWFFSLDAASRAAVRVARKTFHLPYFDARMSCRREGEEVVYRSRRTHRGAQSCEFVGRYRPSGAVYHSTPGSLEAFLTDRLCLCSVDLRGRICRGDISHAPWPLQPASAEIEVNTMVDSLGLRLPDRRPLLHFARQLDVRAWMPQRVAG